MDEFNTIRTMILQHLVPDNSRVALTVNNQPTRYCDFLLDSIELHQRILKQCEKPRKIGIFAYRSAFSYLSTLTSMLSGSTFIYLNPTFPADRLASIINQIDLDLVLVGADSADRFQELTSHLAKQPNVLHELSQDSGATPPPGNTAYYWHSGNSTPLCAEKLAYIKFTSGSTGIPKAVPITYGNLASFICYNQQRYQFTPSDIFSQTFDQSFDLSVFDIFMAFTNGAHLCVPSQLSLLAPTKFINDNQITVWFSVPSLANQMAKRQFLRPDSLPSLRISLFCGEAMPKQTIERWEKAAPQSRIENLYGPTEATIACFAYEWQKQESSAECYNDIVPIGKPYPHLDSILLDENGEEILDNEVPGRLLISGEQIFPGYLGLEDKKQPLKVIGNSDNLYYETGDIASRNPAGCYQFHGRADHQVKINGYRIELGEIESIARSFGALEVAAITFPPGPGAREILFFHKQECDDPDFASLFRLKLPAYMCPHRIIALERLPLNSNGKIDRKQLAELSGLNWLCCVIRS